MRKTAWASSNAVLSGALPVNSFIRSSMIGRLYIRPAGHVDLAGPLGDEPAGLRVRAVVEPQLRLRDSLEVGVRAELVVLGDLFELHVGRGQPQVEAGRVGQHDAALAAQCAVEQVAGDVGELQFGRREEFPAPRRVGSLRVAAAPGPRGE